MAHNDVVRFVSLGGVFLDELRWEDRPPQKDVVGGSATYSTLGVRLFCAEEPEQIAILVQAGHDFPQHTLELLRSWKIKVLVKQHRDLPSARGVLEHQSNLVARFTQLNAPLLSTPNDLAEYGLLGSEVVHFFGSAEIVSHQIHKLTELREQHLTASPPQITVWEPHPKSCTPELLLDHITLLGTGDISVFSPNHNELDAFFSDSKNSKAFGRERVEGHAKRIWSPVKPPGPSLQALIIRAADNGCLVISGPDSQVVWLPAFWTSAQQDNVVDTTGAGNAFLGGLAQGWLETRSWVEAACYGTVAASIIVEHIGPPVLGQYGAEEYWEGVDVRARLAEYMERGDVTAAFDAIRPS